MQPRLALNSGSSHLLRAGITGVHYHVWLQRISSRVQINSQMERCVAEVWGS
jgi:hypothetical protein